MQSQIATNNYSFFVQIVNSRNNLPKDVVHTGLLTLFCNRLRIYMNIDCMIVNSFNYDAFYFWGIFYIELTSRYPPSRDNYFVTLVFISWIKYCIVLYCIVRYNNTYQNSVVINSSINIAGICTSPPPPAETTPIGQTLSSTVISWTCNQHSVTFSNKTGTSCQWRGQGEPSFTSAKHGRIVWNLSCRLPL